jgi:hypothetical protein
MANMGGKKATATVVLEKHNRGMSAMLSNFHFSYTRPVKRSVAKFDEGQPYFKVMDDVMRN